MTLAKMTGLGLSDKAEDLKMTYPWFNHVCNNQSINRTDQSNVPLRFTLLCLPVISVLFANTSFLLIAK
jgi:hypothetical protein